ncbi:MAG: hypothetical protein ACKVS5_01210 [Parvularculaceae bacterium]
MTPARAVLAAILATVMLLAGALIVARTSGRSGADFLEILLAGPAPGLWCFLAAAGAVAFGAAGIFTAFLAFIAREEEDDGPFRRRSFPKAAPLILIVLALALVWYALRCAPAVETADPIAVAVAPEAPVADEVEDALQGGDPVADLDSQFSTILFGDSGFDWTFKDPLIRSGSHQWMTRERPFTDDAAETLLCGKAWVAVTGSASEEGPADRNAERSRLRAMAAAEAARRWIARRSDCGATPVFAVDLGQHAAGSPDETGVATAYQRRVLVVSRVRKTDEVLSPDAASAELAGILANPASIAALLGGRRYRAEPVILTP